VEKASALEKFGLAPGRKTLLVMGGSQGAHGINLAVLNALPQLQNLSLQFVHLAGREDEALVRESYQKAGVAAFVAAFWPQMEVAYSAADFCLARSGAASLTELSHFALPSLLIPYPFAAEDHQTLNAQIFVRAGAAALLPQSEITADKLSEKLRWFLDDPRVCRKCPRGPRHSLPCTPRSALLKPC
jgi:UDP-N-acetylglucosamine--N-acetylmuramyl-(pentapeptide) pyrophosphoryl-undecaprenol N-acetylglucosamine transferase